MRVLKIILVILVLGGMFNMTYLQEVSGKVRTKTITIGGGVDKLHSPLQISSKMASDSMNISSWIYPSAKVRHGRTKYIDSFITPFALPYIGSYYLSTIKPFIDSQNNIHYAIQYVNTTSSPKEIVLLWYILFDGYVVPELVSTITIAASDFINDDSLPTDKYAYCNFTEYKNEVFLFHKYTTGSVNKTGYSDYSFVNRNVSTVYIDTSTTSDYLSPSCVYVDKMYFSDGGKLIWSATGNATDYTTAANSGSVDLAVGGKITSLIPMQDRIFISTERAIHILFGNSFSTISISLLADNIGVLSPKCVTQKNGVVYFSATDGDIYMYTGSSLINLTRESEFTGSKSYVSGGFQKGILNATSLAVEENYLYCVDDRREGNTTYKNVYVLDIAKRIWYEQDYPYETTPMYYTWNTVFNGLTKAYYMIVNTSISESIQQIGTRLYSVDNSEDENQIYQIDTAGVKQKVTNTVIGTITGAGNCYVSFRYMTNELTELINLLQVPVLLGDSATDVAAKCVTDLAALAPWFNFSSSGPNIICETKYVVGNPITRLRVYNDSCTGLTLTDMVETVHGVFDTYETVDDTATDFIWISGALQINPSGKQVLRSLHISHYTKPGTELGVYVSNSVDADDFKKIATLPVSAYKQTSRVMLPFYNNKFSDWIRIKLAGIGNVEIYNMTLEFRVIDKNM